MRFLFRILLLAALAAPTGASLAQTGAPAAPPVTVARPVQRELIEFDEYTGQFAAVDFVEIRARVSGYLQSINFTDGQLVKKGDLLFVIDPRPFEIARDQAKAQLAQAEARLDLANRQLQRAAELRQRDFASGSTFDERQQEMRVAAAAVDTAKAQIRSAELDLEFSHIAAPIAGRIGQHEVSVGNLVTGGAGGATTLLTTIVSLDPIYLVFDMSEADYLAYERAAAKGNLGDTRENKPLVEARLADEKQWSRRGLLDFLDNQVNRSSGTIRARGIIPNPGLFLTPGQFARLRIPASDRYGAILVPDSALVTDQARKLVMTVKEDGTVVPKEVRPGPTTDDGLRIIRAGLSPDDRIVIDGLMRARPGAKVTPQPGKIDAAENR